MSLTLSPVSPRLPKSVRRAIYTLLIAVLLLLPLAATLYSVHTFGGDSWDAYLGKTFTTQNDSFFYWMQARTFGAAGLNGGYYTVDEHPAPATFTHFYYWGLVPVMTYGTFAAVFEWGWGGILILNMVAFTAALAALIAVVRPTIPQLILLILGIGTLGPALLYFAISMQEVLHMAIMVALVAIFFIMYARRENTPLLVRLSGLILLCLGSVARPQYGFLFLPYFYLLARPTTAARLIAFGMSAAAFVIVTGLFSWMSAPFTNSLFDRLGALPTIAEKLALIRAGIDQNLTVWFTEVPLQTRFRSQFMIVLVYAAFTFLIVPLIRRIRLPDMVHRALMPLSFAQSLTILFFPLGVLTLVFTLYSVGDYRDLRTLLPPFLLALVFLIVWKHYAIALVLMVISIGGLGDYHTRAATIGGTVNLNDPANAEFIAEIVPLVRYDPNAPFAWCNTLLFTFGSDYVIPYQLAYLEPGIGLSLVLDWSEIGTDILSRYIFVPLTARIGTEPQSILEATAETTLGTLYINQSVDCDAADP